MLWRVQGEATRIRALVAALEQDEITLDEFSDAAGSLTSEAVQVIAVFLRNTQDENGEEQDRLWAARILCGRIASQTRVLS